MRTRDEVLAELRQRFGTDDYCQSDVNGIDLYGMADHIVATERQRDDYHAMWKAETLAKRELADRIRESESQQAARRVMGAATLKGYLDDLTDAKNACESACHDLASAHERQKANRQWNNAVDALTYYVEAVELDRDLTLGTLGAALLPAPVAASEPVAWALYEGDTMLHATTKQSTRNSWQKDVDRGPRMVPLRIVPLYSAHPSAAAVRVTDAMVEAAAKVGSDNGFDRLYDVPSMYWDAMHKVVTAALQNAASEGASA